MSRTNDEEAFARVGKHIQFPVEKTIRVTWKFGELNYIVIQPHLTVTDEFIQTYTRYILNKNAAIDGADLWVRDTFRPQLVEKMSSPEGRVSVCAQLTALFVPWADYGLKMHTQENGSLTDCAKDILRRDIQIAQMFFRTLTKEEIQSASCFSVLACAVAKFQALLGIKDLFEVNDPLFNSALQDIREKQIRACREKVLREGVFKEFPVSPILDEKGAPWDAHLLPCQMFVESARVRLTQKPTRRDLDDMIAAREEFLQLMDEDRRRNDPYRQLRMVIGDLKGLRDSLPRT